MPVPLEYHDDDSHETRPEGGNGSQSEHRYLELGDILPDPNQARRTFRGIAELAKSIEQFGLLQNLVVHPSQMPGKFELDAGERLHRALQLLKSQCKWNEPVLCLVRTATGDILAGLVENIARDDVPWWRLGYKFAEAIDAGYTQRAIAEAVGHSVTYVSTCVIMARQLAPSVIARLDRMGPSSLTRTQVLKIANLTKSGTTEPDEQWQLKQLDRYLGTVRKRQGAPRGTERTLNQMVVARYKKLKGMSRIGPPLSTVVEAIVEYLEGTSNRLKIPGFDATARVRRRKRNMSVPLED